jgi:hypothetical protein
MPRRRCTANLDGLRFRDSNKLIRVTIDFD